MRLPARGDGASVVRPSAGGDAAAAVRPSTRGVPTDIAMTSKVRLLAHDGRPARRVASPSIAYRHGRGLRRRTWSGVDSFAAPPPEAPSVAPPPPRRRVPVPVSPRAHVPDPRRSVAPRPHPRAISRTLVLASASRTSLPLRPRSPVRPPRCHAPAFLSPRPTPPPPPRPRLSAHVRAPTPYFAVAVASPVSAAPAGVRRCRAAVDMAPVARPWRLEGRARQCLNPDAEGGLFRAGAFPPRC